VRLLSFSSTLHGNQPAACGITGLSSSIWKRHGNMKVISFFIRNGKYPEMAQRLGASCQRLGLSHWAPELSDQGDWKKSTNFKPRFILSTMFELRSPLLWVDIDTEILRLPSLFWQGVTDFAIYN
jgi:hypothetical protein